MINPRDYQAFAWEAWLNWVTDGKGNPLLLYPTGVGKSVIIALIISNCIRRWQGTRTMVLTHSKELIDQDYKKLKQYWPEAPAGIYCEGLKRKEYWYPITVGSIQTVHNVPELFGHIDVLFIDEAHLVSPKDKTMYRKFIGKLKEKNSNLVVTGLTATGWRSGQGWLWMGENPLFDGAAINACDIDTFNWFFDEGYLVEPIAKKTKFQYDVTNIRTTAGEFNQGDVERETNKKELNERCVIAMLDELQQRHAGLIFVNGIKQVEAVADIFDAYGINVTYVHSDMKDKERDGRIKDFTDGNWHVMVNNGILTTGFDYPALDFMGMMKLTQSSSLFGQMVGRLTRPFYADGFDLNTTEGRLAAIANSHKLNGILFDFAKNSERHGPINDPVVKIPGQRKRPGEAPIKVCDMCGSYNHASAPQCKVCDFVFPRAEKFNDETSGRAIVKKSRVPVERKEPTIIWFDVDSISYSVHTSRSGKAPSLKVTYQCGHRRFDEWIHLEGIGAAKTRAVNWWMTRAKCNPQAVPKTINEAIKVTGLLRDPARVMISVGDKYKEVKDYEYEDSAVSLVADRISAGVD